MPAPCRVIFGTAGHVDHGKSALVLALTGTDPDRLAEEKAREMTIDLGFAFVSLPGFDEPAAIVDVPGHEMFVRNMVAGATGIDAAIFVVAADEGVMPQTVEHLDVLRYLQVSTGVIALTKIDKVAPQLAAQAAQQVRDLVRDTFLRDAPLVPVSALTGEGLARLRQELARIAAEVQPRCAEGAFRLPIDRVFTLKGVGTVVTGTVVSGSLGVGETVTCLPQGRDLRARALQVHNQPVERIFAGQRAAVNLADIAKQDLERGDVLTTPGSFAPTLMLDARLALSAGTPRALGQRNRLRVHHGTREVMARVVLLQGTALAPGQSALVQLRLEAPLVAASGDPFVIRSYSPMRVIGGGTILDPHPPKRRAGVEAGDLKQRETLLPDEVVLETLEGAAERGMAFDELRVRCGLSEAALRAALNQAQAQGRVMAGRRDLWFAAGAVEEMRSAIARRLGALHGAEPLRMFAALNAVWAGVAPSAQHREGFRLALDSLIAQGVVVSAGERLRLASHAPRWSGRYGQAREVVLQRCHAAGLAAPPVHELAAAVGLQEQECRRLLEALVDNGELHLLAPGIYVHPDAITRARVALRQHLLRHGKITVSQCRDLLGASRKYLLPLLEQFDREGLTLRQGDYRMLRPVAPPNEANAENGAPRAPAAPGASPGQ